MNSPLRHRILRRATTLALVAQVLMLGVAPLALAAGPMKRPVAPQGVPACGEPSDCPALMLVKRQIDDGGAPTTAAVELGDVARFEIVAWNAGPGIATDVVVEDVGDWSVDAPEAMGCSSSGTPDGTQGISCDLGDLAPSGIDGGVSLFVSRVTTVDDCGGIENTATVRATNAGGAPVEATASISVSCPAPELNLLKSADTTSVAITGSGADLIATPSLVTWTISYQHTGGAATGVTITDVLPSGLVFVDASDGGSFGNGVVTWSFASVTATDSVTVTTAIDPETVSRVGPTVNVAVIDSDQADPVQASASFVVTVEGPPLGGNPPGPTPPAAPPPPSAPLGGAPAVGERSGVLGGVPNTAIVTPTSGRVTLLEVLGTAMLCLAVGSAVVRRPSTTTRRPVPRARGSDAAR